METKIIDGKEYTKVAIKDLSINGEKNDNSFSVDNLNNQNEISFDIKVDYNTDNNPATFTTSYLDDKNTKTNKKIGKDVSISFIKNMGKVYNIYDLYKEFYNKENIDELYDLSNPSSNNLSSKF